jgi:hypothetical protein
MHMFSCVCMCICRCTLLIGEGSLIPGGERNLSMHVCVCVCVMGLAQVGECRMDGRSSRIMESERLMSPLILFFY